MDVLKFERVAEGRFYQGEVLSGVNQSVVRRNTHEDPSLEIIEHPYAIVLSQDCDLEQSDARVARGHAENLPNVLMCIAVPVAELKGNVGGSDIWKRVRSNSDERYHCIEAIPKGVDAKVQGVPSLGVDFKRYFTVPTEELLEQLRLRVVERRAKLAVPYAEHLCYRFSAYLGRIALPENMVIE